MGFNGCNSAVADAPSRNDREAIERHTLRCNDLPAGTIPFRLEIILLQHIARCRFDPVRVDSRERSCVEPRGLSELRRD